MCSITQKRQFKNQPAPDITFNFDPHWVTIKRAGASQTIKGRLRLGEKTRNWSGSLLPFFSLCFLSTPRSSSFWFWPDFLLWDLKANKNPNQQNLGRYFQTAFLSQFHYFSSCLFKASSKPQLLPVIHWPLPLPWSLSYSLVSSTVLWLVSRFHTSHSLHLLTSSSKIYKLGVPVCCSQEEEEVKQYPEFLGDDRITLKMGKGEL